jgi:hypothetical protein
MNIRVLLIALAWVLATADVAQADSLAIAPPGQQVQAHRHPAPGSRMDQVEQSLGSPVRKLDPVGDPPITRWVYPDFVVYFEYQLVLHTVRRHPSDAG